MKEIKSFLIALFITILSFTQAFAQNEPFEKVDRQYSFIIEDTYIYKTNIDSVTINGIGAEIDHAWKLSGYHLKKNAYISVMIGYEVLLSKKDYDLSILSYGWSVRHELTKGKKWTPYFGYGLLLNQLWIESVKGNVMGHQTRMAIGFDRKISDQLVFNLALRQSYTRFPGLGLEEARKIQRLALVVGLRL